MTPLFFSARLRGKIPSQSVQNRSTHVVMVEYYEDLLHIK